MEFTIEFEADGAPGRLVWKLLDADFGEGALVSIEHPTAADQIEMVLRENVLLAYVHGIIQDDLTPFADGIVGGLLALEEAAPERFAFKIPDDWPMPPDEPPGGGGAVW